MEPKQKKIILIIAVIVIAIVAFLYFKNKKKKEDESGSQQEPDPASNSLGSILNSSEKTPNPKGAADTMSVFPLKMGSRNPQVKNLQTWLLKNEGAQIKVDGVWGKETDAAVKKFLKLDNISKDKYASMGLK